MRELYASKVKGKVYRLIFEMNKSVRVQVKTPLGMTELKEAGAGPSQGNVDTALVSANSMGNSVRETFKEEEEEMKYGNDVVISALAFLDDIAKMSETRVKAQEANNKVEEMMNRKGLELNIGKSNFLLVGNKKEQKRMQKEIDDNPLKLCKKDMKQVKGVKYLKDFILSDLCSYYTKQY